VNQWVTPCSRNRSTTSRSKLPGGLDQDRIEFLSDVASFANASGGDIFYGVVDKREDGKPTGIPESAPGLNEPNADATILRLEQMVRSNIDPKIPGFRMQAIPGFANGPVIHAHIPRSYLGLHAVRQKDWVRFYTRGSAGKQLLDATEIRSAFAITESFPERIRRLRAERLARIMDDQIPSRLRRGPTLVMHVVPIASLDVGTKVDLSGLERDNQVFGPLDLNNYETRFNLDGLFLHRTDRSTRACLGYVQVFRSGIVESVWSALVEANETAKVLPTPAIVHYSSQGLGRYLTGVRNLGLEPPVFILPSFFGVEGWAISQRGQRRESVDRDVLLLPEVVVEDYAQKPAQVLQPAFDALWQSSGWVRCPHYDKEGNLPAQWN
jgi:hypothetical protein